MLGQAEYLGACVVFQLLTPGPLLAPELAPLGALYLLPEQREAEAAARLDRLRAVVGTPPVAVDLLGLQDDVAWLAGDLRRAHRVADIAMIGTTETWAVPWLHRRVAETLALGSGTPLVILPPGRALRRVDHAVVGWKSSAEAVRALHDLVTLAEPGARIQLVSIGHGPASADEVRDEAQVVDYLALHGFQAEASRIAEEGDVAQRLTIFALDQGADLLVVGAFAHARLRELMLGGVTEALICDAHLPVLLSH